MYINNETLFPITINPGQAPTPHCGAQPRQQPPASKQLKLSVLDGNRSFDLVNAKPVRYHCTSQKLGS
ncbi:hypothetical protein SK128_024582 [Halocaridina rubra]|uniref:Uncharacterized protein n=1 Tax=Halocaridina rubra TaxID=373956 RepID=A0AAN8XD82_HALRR